MRIPLTMAAVVCCASLLYAQGPDWTEVEAVFGRTGTERAGVFKVAFPRGDLQVRVGDVLVDPGLALTSWIAFQPAGDGVMIMGDLVMLDAEVKPVMARLVRDGIRVSALHNHIVGESPSIMFMHFGGTGHPVALARTLKAGLALTGTPVGPPPSAGPAPVPNWGPVESIMGRSGQQSGALLKFGIARGERITAHGMEVPPFMGSATAINFQAVGARAAVTGDFVLTAGEVDDVVTALTDHGIAVTALHNHMVHESPRLFFMHFWGLDTPAALARGLRAALDRTNSARN